MNKTAIKNFAIWARRKIISDITYKAGMLGITEKGIAQPMQQSTSDLQFFDIGTKDYVEISGAEIMQRKALVSVIREKEKTADYQRAFRGVIEEVAYTWFNRLIAIRFMEVNNYLPSGIRVLSSENPDKLEPDFVTNPFDTDLEFNPYEKDVVLQMKEQNKLDELFRMLFIKQCNKLNENLPELFEQISDYTEILLTISFTDKDGVVYHLTHDISEDDFNVAKEGQVEIIGWLYQYYNTEPKDEVFALLKKNVKITKERIPAVTQLFTPDWIVRYMVENSLGRLWVEGHPNDNLKASWKYYLEEAEQEPEVQEQLARIYEEFAKMNPEDIKVIDPCMGSGHILVYAFDVLMQIYLSYGYTKHDAVKSILAKNLYGIDIDTRAYQLAYFAVMMKARQYSRKVFDEKICPNLMAVRNSVSCSEDAIRKLGTFAPIGRRLINDYRDAEEYGSILNINYTADELDALEGKLAEIGEMSDYGTLVDQLLADECTSGIFPLIRQARIMGQKYDVVITNPPYMGISNGTGKLNDFVKKYYPNSKADLYSVFIEKCLDMAKNGGYQAMITQHSWMFLGSFEELRKKVKTYMSVSMAHLGARAFDEISGEVVQTTSFVLKKQSLKGYRSKYSRLVDGENEEEKRDIFLKKEKIYIANVENYSYIPGEPIAYWLSNAFIKCFGNKKIADFGETREGVTTANNDKFLRMWSEVALNNIHFGCGSQEESELSGLKWYPHHKGGEYRRWYGNCDYVIHWQYGGKEVQNFKDEKTGRIRSHNYNLDYVFKEYATWSRISSENVGLRFSSKGFVFDSSSAGLFLPHPLLKYGMGFVSSCVAKPLLNVLNPTITIQPGDVADLPLIVDDEKTGRVENCVNQNIGLSKSDWDSFEASWEYRENPLTKGEVEGRLIADKYKEWDTECDNRFNQIKANEEELNRIFIDIYGLQDELLPEVEDMDVTVRKANLQRDIKSLISYAVGCMFGRYSLDVEYLAYAGGDWDDSKYKTFIPDVDNCIPITDEEYFNDDVVGRFVEFVRVVYGEATLEENLEFIAGALGSGGRTPRETIRQYFIKDFFKDHCQTYSVAGSGKRPIYWLFDSGKQNGFKALVYMHRWSADTVGNVRVEYLHKMQQVYEKEIVSCQEIIDSNISNREKTVATKRMEKLVKQLKECKDYDAKIAHIALSRIDIDLDDGVKVNYRKVQTGNDGRFCEILADSKDIMVKEDSTLWQNLVSSR